jgi:hypothetical protein
MPPTSTQYECNTSTGTCEPSTTGKYPTKLDCQAICHKPSPGKKVVGKCCKGWGAKCGPSGECINGKWDCAANCNDSETDCKACSKGTTYEWCSNNQTANCTPGSGPDPSPNTGKQRPDPPHGYCSNGKQIRTCERSGVPPPTTYITTGSGNGNGEASTTMYTPIESTNANLGFGCSSCSKLYTPPAPSPTQCSADSYSSTAPHIGYGPDCTCIRDIAEQLASIPTPSGVLGWVILASASPMRTTDGGTPGKTATAPGGSCWELTPSRISTYPSTWSTDNNNIPASPTNQKLYGVVLGKCPCNTNKKFCCCTGGNNGGVKTYNHFDIWFPGCTPNMPADNPGKQCYAKMYCGMASYCGGPDDQNTYCPENQYPCWSALQRGWGKYTGGNTTPQWDTMQNWNVKFKQIQPVSQVLKIMSEHNCVTTQTVQKPI